MSLVATVVDPLAGPAPEGWDEFVTAQWLLPVWHSDLLRTSDWCWTTASSMVLVREQGSGEPVAAFHARHRGPGRPGRFATPGRLPVASLTECRTAPYPDVGLAFATGADERDRKEAVRVFERAVRQRAGPGAVAIAYRGLRDRHLRLVPSRRLRLPLSPVMVLDNEWSDLASYVGSLAGKWRSQLRKLHDTVQADPGLRVDWVPAVDPAEACWLAEVVTRRHASGVVPDPPLPAGYFARLGRLPGSRFLTYRDDRARLVGLTALHDDGRDLVLLCWGTRGPTDGRRSNLYFDQYLRLVDLMLSSVRRRLVLGPGMQEIKARYGARPERRWGVVGLR